MTAGLWTRDAAGCHNEQITVLVLQVTDPTGGGSLREEGNWLNNLESC